jgi:hypothetical protein
MAKRPEWPAQLARLALNFRWVSALPTRRFFRAH